MYGKTCENEHFSFDFRFGSRDHYLPTAGIKQFIFLKGKVKKQFSRDISQRKRYVFYRVSADGSCSIKWKWKDINAGASVTHSWRRLPLVTWLLCRACGWLGGPSGCAAPVFELSDELCPRTLDTSGQLTWAHRKREWSASQAKKRSALLKDTLTVDGKESTFSW